MVAIIDLLLAYYLIIFPGLSITVNWLWFTTVSYHLSYGLALILTSSYKLLGYSGWVGW